MSGKHYEGMVKSLFNACVLCDRDGKRVALEMDSASHTTKPCRVCGASFGPFYVPKDHKSLSWYKGLDPLPDYGTSKT